MGFSWANAGATLTTAALTSALTGAPAAPAQARADAFPCGAPFEVTIGRDVHTVQKCPDWSDSGRIEVYADTSVDSGAVGEVSVAGDQWYECGRQGGSVYLSGGDVGNDWWARTRANTGRWGYVSQLYFKGGGNFEPDAGLRRC
ncbi:hypothetical protein [Nonomuraea zeae]|uniref:Uncharacterized protein n=1 Tax=Nonomuraea zeae TaxID=1642303 RepID=A0A5S4GC48_9ACTN|nr:hypothetical protein [Nonomuraea zeae]TMR23600.1 hypothetical protein ETD85_47645 [Nonomuraea zeae]